MQNYICLDIETTGLDRKSDHIIEIAAVKFNATETFEQFKTFIFYPDQIPEIVEHLTGINQSMLIGAPTLEDIKQELLDFCGDLPIVGHNISFDIGFLHKFDIPVPGTPIDTIHLAQTFLESQSYSLETLSQNFNTKFQPSHRALDDVLANIELFQSFLRKIQNLNPQQSYLWQEILNKSTDPYHQILLQYLPTTQEKPSFQTLKSPTTEIQSTNLQTKDLQRKSQNIINELRDKDQNHLFVIDQNQFQKIQYDNKLPAYNSLISTQEFQTYLQDSEHLNSEESTLLLKIATQITKKHPLYSTDLNLFKKDYTYINYFKSDLYYFPSNQKAYLCDHFTFFKLHFNQELPHFQSIHFENTPFLEEVYIKSQQTDITLESSDNGQDINELNFAFVHLAKYAQQLQKEMDYPRSTIILNALDLSSQEFTNFIHSLKKFSPNPHIINASQKIKHQSSKYLIWINLDHSQEASLHFVEKNIHLQIKETLQSTNSKELYLYEQTQSQDSFTIQIQKDLPEPNNENHTNLLSQYLLKELSTIQSQAVIIATSKNQITELHKILANQLDSKGISLLSQYVSGSKGKILNNISNNEGPHVLMCTHHFLLRNNPDLQNIEKAFLTKIPMGLPFHPYYNWLKKETDNDFFKLTLPYTANIIYQICQNLSTQNPKLNHLNMCDIRLTKLNWANTILKQLPENIVVEQS